MRGLLDTSILVSNLYSAKPTTSATGAVLQAALERRFTLLLLDDVIDELYRTIAEHPDLAARISQVQAEQIVQSLLQVAEEAPQVPPPYPPVTRDPNDDFLIAHAVATNADYLVSWDKDLRDLAEYNGIKLVSPPAFLQALRQAEQG